MSEGQWFIIVLSAAFTENILLYRFLGLCSFTACSRRWDTALGLGIAVTFVSTCTTPLNYVLYRYVLLPLGLEHMQYLLFIALIAAFVQLVEMVMERHATRLYYALGIFLPLITVNCAILGATLFAVMRQLTFLDAVGYGFGCGLGWMLAILLMAGLRSRVKTDEIPEPWRGVALTMVLTGILAMILRGFAGLGMSS